MTNLQSLSTTAVGPTYELAEPPSRLFTAIVDLLDGVRRTWHWTTLAQQDIKLRYRGSVLGPFWQTLTTAVMIGGMGVIYSKLFHQDLHAYLTMLTLGLL